LFLGRRLRQQFRVGLVRKAVAVVLRRELLSFLEPLDKRAREFMGDERVLAISSAFGKLPNAHIAYKVDEHSPQVLTVLLKNLGQNIDYNHHLW